VNNTNTITEKADAGQNSALDDLRAAHASLMEARGAGNGLRFRVRPGLEIAEEANALAQRAIGGAIPMAERRRLAALAVEKDASLRPTLGGLVAHP